MKRLLAAAAFAALAFGGTAQAQRDDDGRRPDRSWSSDDSGTRAGGRRARDDAPALVGGPLADSGAQVADRGWDRDRGGDRGRDRDRDSDWGSNDRGRDNDWNRGGDSWNNNRDRDRNRDWDRNDWGSNDWNRNDWNRSWDRGRDRDRRDHHYAWRDRPHYGRDIYYGSYHYRARPIWNSWGIPSVYSSRFFWGVGSYYPYDWRHYQVVDFYNYYLPPPPHHHVWVRHDDGAYLVALATGLIVGLAISDAYYY